MVSRSIVPGLLTVISESSLNPASQVLHMADISPKNTTGGPRPGPLTTDPPPSGDFKVEESIQQLKDLQQQITELRHRMPSLLRSLATIQDSDSAQAVFGRTAKEATLLQTKVDEFVQNSRQSQHVFKYIETRKKELESGVSSAPEPVKIEKLESSIKVDDTVDQLGMDDLDMLDFNGGGDETSALFDDMYNA
ncbi:YALI0F14289p [Yarrowia lipolytica CLIB122]|jgi:hypothetical protein|uniref:YALI0F14289p n=3 Tax=Yarrowia lipolytica TaxID=4952 RepID=Q6C1Q6_YARLI|nr:YALI0F14289p [Yarrowia lipolytica CLIB122]AOW07169.1 hypothetical protein YALI1_F19140g [Yarrowia lipolytica]CAG78215.1 YALI0F14289p [Yarrowia lipolytica CLIB122]VBB82921.1 Hypothetical protein conserved in the Yarrowia clade [Yarrowia lipolytica]|eukprot:XP_505406.1 YALI0F14289p [Yarrowia lipolytica CLIB122]